MLRASIDIGSNSTLLLIAKVESSSIKEVIRRESRVTGLGRELDQHKAFLPASQDETLEALREYAKICHAEGVGPSQIISTATEASRVAKNASEFFTQVRDELGINVHIITPEAEAKYTATGILQAVKEKEDVGVLDIGGASTELISISTGLSPLDLNLSSFSLPVGAVRVSNWMASGRWPKKFHDALDPFRSKLKSFKVKKLYCSAGTMTSIANMKLGHSTFVENDVHEFILCKEDIKQLIDTYQKYLPSDFLERFPFLGKRAHSIKGGLLLINALGDYLDMDEYVVTTYGLRYGTLIAGKIEQKDLAKVI